MAEDHDRAYDDGLISCDAAGLVMRRYYPWGAKRIPYASIKRVETLSLTGAERDAQVADLG